MMRTQAWKNMRREYFGRRKRQCKRIQAEAQLTHPRKKSELTQPEEPKEGKKEIGYVGQGPNNVGLLSILFQVQQEDLGGA